MFNFNSVFITIYSYYCEVSKIDKFTVIGNMLMVTTFGLVVEATTVKFTGGRVLLSVGCD